MRHRDLSFGVHVAQAALAQGRALELWLDQARQDARTRTLLEAAQMAGIPTHLVSRGELDGLAPQVRHQGVVVRCRSRESLTEEDLPALLGVVEGPPLLLVLDGVQDPHNLGACLRTAEAAGVHAVIAPRDRAAGLTATVRKVSSGAADAVTFVQVTNLARTLRLLKVEGVWLVGAAGQASGCVYDADLTGPLALVMGAEEKGLRRLTAEHCDLLVHIPMAGTVESLNVSVATGVCLFEAVRQRRAADGV